MDKIIIRFGSKRITAEERLEIEYAKQQLKELDEIPQLSELDYVKKHKKKLKKIIEKDSVNQEFSIQDFLKLNPDKLPKKEKQVQRILSFLYQQNQSDEPVYKKFPERDEPLVIDCTTISFKGTGGVYNNVVNTILMCHNNCGDAALINVLAHELKHAEQWIDETKTEYNAYQKHQISFLKEAQASACGQWVKRRFLNADEGDVALSDEDRALLDLFGGLKKFQDFTRGSMASKDMAFHLNNFLDNERCYQSYKDTYDERTPILYTDKGLTRIPSVFGIEKEDEVKILKILNKRVPRKARSVENQIKQAVLNKDAKLVKALLPLRDKKGNYLVNRESMTYLIVAGCCNDLKMCQSVWQSGRVDDEDVKLLLASVMHIEEGLGCSEKDLKEKEKILVYLATTKNKKGEFLLSDNELNESLEFASMMEEKEIEGLIKKVKVHLKRKRLNTIKNKKDDYLK